VYAHCWASDQGIDREYWLRLAGDQNDTARKEVLTHKYEQLSAGLGELKRG